MKILSAIVFVLCAACSKVVPEPPPASIRELVAIRIPRIKVEDAPLEDCINFIAMRIMELDPHKPGGISFLSSGFKNRKEVPAEDIKTASYSAENVRVDKVLTDIARLFDVAFHVTDIGVVVTPSDGLPFPNTKAENGEVYYSYRYKNAQHQD